MKFLPRFVILFWGFLFSINTWAIDTLELKFLSMKACSEKSNIYADVYKLKGNINRNDSVVKFSDGTITNKYIITSLIFQQQPKLKIENKMSVILGCDTAFNLFVVLDKNYNENFSDDSVFKIKMNSESEDSYSFYQKVPVIKLDSIKLIDSMGGVTYIHEELKIAPIPSNERFAFFKDKKQIKNADGFSLAIYAIRIYSSVFSIDTVSYKVFLRINPLYSNYLNQSKPDFNKEAILQIYKKSNDNWSLIDYRNVSLLEEKDNEKNYLLLDNSFLILNEVDWNTFKFKFTISKTRPLDSNQIYIKADKIITYKSPSFKTHYEEYLISHIKEYTIIEFSGSWCAPCKKILPSLKKLFSVYGDKIAFKTIAVEESYQNAESYFIESKIPWGFFYENMENCDSGFCLKQYLNIRLFPTFILFNKNGIEIFKGESIEALELLRNRLITLK